MVIVRDITMIKHLKLDICKKVKNYSIMKKLFKLPARFIWVLGAIIILQACYPGGSIPITDLDTATTLYKSDDFATAPVSAALNWDVIEIEDPDGENLPYDGEQDDAILNTTLTELVKLYGEDNVIIISATATPVPAPVNTNVLVFVPTVDLVPSSETLYVPSIVLRKETIVYSYPGYGWGGWWGGWYPGGCYYCGYPSYGTATYQTGTVLLDMYDLRQIPNGGPVPPGFDMSWIGQLKGLLSTTPSTSTSRVVSGIQKLFEQSPYLK